MSRAKVLPSSSIFRLWGLLLGSTVNKGMKHSSLRKTDWETEKRAGVVGERSQPTRVLGQAAFRVSQRKASAQVAPATGAGPTASGFALPSERRLVLEPSRFWQAFPSLPRRRA